MRELKFRAWNGEKMIYGSRQDEYDDFYMLNLQGEFFPHTRTGDEYFLKDKDPYNQMNYTLMQYTGLKDKNGKEIYEGDIVRFDFKHSEGREATSEVKWHNYAWRLASIWLLTEISKIEVIGNIYENPELLKQ